MSHSSPNLGDSLSFLDQDVGGCLDTKRGLDAKEIKDTRSKWYVSLQGNTWLWWVNIYLIVCVCICIPIYIWMCLLKIVKNVLILRLIKFSETKIFFGSITTSTRYRLMNRIKRIVLAIAETHVKLLSFFYKKILSSFLSSVVE